MIIRNFEYLLALARERHFSRAAAACNVSQPTLSGGIKQLEEDMDVRIVERGRTFEGFTAEGERVLAWAQQMMDDCTRLKHELRSFRESAMQGPFRIGVLPATTSLGTQLSVPFAEQASQLELSIRTASSLELLNLVRSGDLDVAITYLDDTSSEGLATHLLYRERMLFFSAKSPITSNRVAMKQIIEQPLCLLTAGLPASLSEQLALAPKVLYTDSIAMLAAHLRTGAWSTVLPQSLANELMPSPKLQAAPLQSGAHADAAVGFVTARVTPLPASLHAFMELAHTPQVVASLREMLSAHEPMLNSGVRKKSS
ncbi:LysR family transcriptional regulator [Granulicella cerasi]|uniref:LysR family transcriptional regulator n=1 Tax=Granulicella cerasi TaxID=741063 RepID=A0ABW1ZDY1_9BACT|nr:LysR family transcriptional regulator [Granulicella cerasi]